MTQHLSLLSKLASGKAPAGTTFDDSPAPEEILKDLKGDGRFASPIPMPFNHLGEENPTPPTDPMDFTFSKPKAPVSEKFLEVKPPFEFDGTPSEWSQWRAAVELYITENRYRFRSGLAVLDVISASTKHGSRAKSTLTHLTKAIFLTGTVEKAEFEALTQPFQVFLWIMTKLEPFFQDGTLMTKALAILRHQQRTTPVLEWMQKLDEARMTLGMSHDSLMVFALSGIDTNLAAWISAKVNKPTISLTWADIQQWGPMCEEELRRMHGPMKSYHSATAHHVRAHAASVTSSDTPSSAGTSNYQSPSVSNA